ncbi:DUF1877 family protein [Pedobacter helvus]|uniref:DUF1877 family protein n=1 Tax=Pedobacter helvus TaxID=2563444 RepID=A0ABW9JKR4_9SPHI|nr:DUF1877 family protein [Pedobacter ureilyticus]
MSQSATLYRISNDTFRQLETSADRPQFEISSAKNYTTFQGSFMGLEYILSKGQDISTTEIINEIFNPKKSLGGQDIEKLSLEEQMEFYENGGVIYYLDTTTISKLNNLLDTFSEADIQTKYDANELNDNGIYPAVWHNDNSPDQAYNKRHIIEDFKELKTIINQAREDNDYIFVFVG